MEKTNEIFEGLNPAQKAAVEDYEGAALIVAGAGSGKTKVLTCRIANVIAHGNPPESVLALTFTNKASREMKERIAAAVGSGLASRIWMGTFHSIFARILRQEAELLGYPRSFTIYDTTDSRNVIKSCIKELGLDDKVYKPNDVKNRISMAKNNLILPGRYRTTEELMQQDAASRKPRLCDIFELYDRKCKDAGSMDFDDILLNMNILFRDFSDALERVSSKFKYILVDEYQDTNFAQYNIIRKLAAGTGNIAVVGDDSQSIYSFRGARIENILNFVKDYPQARVYRLEQNYRSTRTIVEAANSLINKNTSRIKKTCFSKAEQGDKIELIKAYTEQEEAFMVSMSIKQLINNNKLNYNCFAVLYRTNAQSRAIEEALRRQALPYKIYAGHSFFDRAEVKDFLAYLRLIDNPMDNESFRRIINFPVRGIGNITLGKVTDAASAARRSIFEFILSPDLETAGLRPAVADKLKNFCETISRIAGKKDVENAFDIASEVNSAFGIINFLRSDTSIEGQNKLSNLEELYNSIKEFVDAGADENVEEDTGPEETRTVSADLDVSLSGYLQNVALISDLDIKEDGEKDEDNDKISLMTVHAAKGLEFDYVYIVGAEENLFPPGGTLASPREIEEERRLFYVAVTRARKCVKISFAGSRMKWGSTVNNRPSRFIREIDKCYISNPVDDSCGPDKAGAGKSYGGNMYGRSAGHASCGMRNSGQEMKKKPFSSGNDVPVFRKPAVQRTSASDFRPDDPSEIAVGQSIEHDRFGKGKVVSMDGMPGNMRAIVDFENGGRKTLLLKFAKIRIIK
ncbi:MAG: UvrD-helicase domain-containing protein [Bacteroidales bacterium]|jgi:DNA helicase-2/ATP-dependent DNA helicase PcrA|nr:UvrD-helicase domain-containing protein [Bacteroidales bacterium]